MLHQQKEIGIWDAVAHLYGMRVPMYSYAALRIELSSVNFQYL